MKNPHNPAVDMPSLKLYLLGATCACAGQKRRVAQKIVSEKPVTKKIREGVQRRDDEAAGHAYCRLQGLNPLGCHQETFAVERFMFGSQSRINKVEHFWVIS
jgi:hypothetical protein